MKVLVTGATGFIGNHVILALQQKGCSIIASSANAEHARSREWFGKISYYPLDFKNLDDNKNYYQLFEEPDLLIHLAWEGLPNYKSDFHEQVNLPHHFMFLSNMIRNGLGDLTITGTCFEYGMREGLLNEKMEPAPANSYARAKNGLRILLEELKSVHSFSLKWVRLFYMFGKGQNPNSLLSQLESALQRGDAEFRMSGGEQVRDYLPVEKVAENIVAIAFQKQIEGVINNCSGVPVTIKELVNDFLQQRKKQIKLELGAFPYPDYEPMRFWGDNKKLKMIIAND